MNAYDFLLSLDRLDGQLIDETMDCLYPKERRSGRRVVRTLLIAAVLASLFDGLHGICSVAVIDVFRFLG